jgi:ABC-type dipeptide/oligopeptide/nickel transport system permease component
MAKYIIRSILVAIPTIFFVILVVFLSLRLAPGCPALTLAPPDARPEDIAAIRKELDLDYPLYIQFFRFLTRVSRGDLGLSFRTGRPVVVEIMDRYPATLQLAGLSILLATIVGVIAGVVAAATRNSIFDNISMVVALFGISAPVFWLGLMLMLIFSVYLGWLPTVGRGTFSHIILPAVTLGAASTAIIARMTRSSMLEIIGQDYIRTARSKGLKEHSVLIRHALRNALIPVVTVIGLQLGGLLGGAVITETVFAWPGLGRLLVMAIFWRDFPLVQGGVILIAVTFVLVNLAVDISYAYLDPKIQY